MNWSRCGLFVALCATGFAQSNERTAFEREGLRHLERGYDLAGEGKREEAIVEYQQALTIHRRVFGAEDLRTLTNMNLLASARLMSGDVAGAERLLREIIDSARERYPRDAQLAEALGGLAYIVARRGELPEAQALADEALALSLAVEGEQSIDSAMLYANAGEIQRLSGRDERALPLYRKARAIYEKQLDAGNPRVASVLSQEGLILMNSGQLTLAGQAMTRALDILRRSCPACMTETWTAESNLALLRMKQEKFGEADRLLSDVLAMQKRPLPCGRRSAGTETPFGSTIAPTGCSRPIENSQGWRPFPVIVGSLFRSRSRQDAKNA
jgi:hypothetical protein